MSPSSHVPTKHDDSVPQLPGFSQEFSLELGFSTSNPREQLEERQMHCSTPPVSVKENVYSRVKSVHGVIEHHDSASPNIVESRPKIMTAVSEGVEREEDIGTQREAMNSLDWIEEKRKSFTPTSSPVHEHMFASRGSSLRAETAPSSPVEQQQSIHSQSQPLRPPPRSSSYSNAPQFQERQLPDHERYSLVDSGPIAAPVARRVASDSGALPSRERVSGGLTPPRQRRQHVGVSPPNSASKYATFEEMGIRGRGIAEVQAEKVDRDCVIM